MSIDHYENFPVASLLAPPALRPAILALYRWARTADDLADEGDASPVQRLTSLHAMHADLERLQAGTPAQQPVLQTLAPHIAEHALPLAPLFDLLSAFCQDVTITRYADEAQLLDYCRRSANPVGRLMLRLFRCEDAPALAASDAICTALQLTNFWQDVAIDWRKGRRYLPTTALVAHGLDETALAEMDAGAPCTAPWAALMRERVADTRALFLRGAHLPHRLGGRTGLELRLVIQGGLRILERIDAVQGDVFRYRPTLSRGDWLRLTARAFLM